MAVPLMGTRGTRGMTLPLRCGRSRPPCRHFAPPARVSTLPAQRPSCSSNIGAMLLISACCASSETKTTGGLFSSLCQNNHRSKGQSSDAACLCQQAGRLETSCRELRSEAVGCQQSEVHICFLRKDSKTGY